MAPTIETALSQFRAAAIEKGDFATPAQRDHALHRQMKGAAEALDAAGDLGEAAFRTLLEDESAHVRSWAAAELLSRGDPAARSVLERIAREAGPIALAAKMTLGEHRAGHLRSPFA